MTGNRERDERNASGDDTALQEDDADTERMDIGNEDAAFVLGRGGATKRKIARVCEAELNLNDEASKISIKGTELQRKRAKDYIKYICDQRVGKVYVDLTDYREDLTVVEVPDDCVAFVMGRGGNTLRTMEEEWGTLMFFALDTNTKEEKLMIFGKLRNRRGAELKVMSAVEHKLRKHFVDDGQLKLSTRLEGDQDSEGFGIDTKLLGENEFSYALGSKGSTRRKLAAASGAVIEYVGHLACVAGFEEERKRGLQYLKWLLQQRQGGTVEAGDPGARDDCMVLEVPSESIGYITGHKGTSLRDVELRSSTFCFSAGHGKSRGEAKEKLFVFSSTGRNRERAKQILEDMIEEHKRIGGRGGGQRPNAGGGFRGGGDRGGGGRGFDRRERGYDRRDERRDDRGGDRRYRDHDGGGRGRGRDRSRSRDRGGGDRYNDRGGDRGGGARRERRDDRRDDRGRGDNNRGENNGRRDDERARRDRGREGRYEDSRPPRRDQERDRDDDRRRRDRADEDRGEDSRRPREREDEDRKGAHIKAEQQMDNMHKMDEDSPPAHSDEE
jgi:hypothetical protein